MTAPVVSGCAYTEELCESRNRLLMGLNSVATAGDALVPSPGVAAFGIGVAASAKVPIMPNNSRIAVIVIAL